MKAYSPDAFLKICRHPIKWRLFLLFRLPSAFFSGVRVIEISEKKSVISVPYKWFSQNPFRSTYFACLAMAAEMSSGLLAMCYIYKRNPGVSMLVVKMEAQYFKKAVGYTFFKCHEGTAIKEAVERAILSGEGQMITVTATGINENSEKVAEFLFTWSFKVKKN
jgi:hypothetical protein